MQDLNDLYYYVQAVDHGGFAPAGRALVRALIDFLAERFDMLRED